MATEEQAFVDPIEALLPFLDQQEGEGDGSEEAAVGDGGMDGKSAASPWSGDERLYVSAAGGIVARERDAAILARGFSDSVEGDSRTEVRGDFERTTDGDATVDVEGGTDRIDVAGEAAIDFDERMVRMSGTIERRWTGPITRIAGMEGVICGGAFTKVHAAPSMTVSALATGDVYGACARFAGARVHVAGLHYRAASVAMWRTGVYLRSAATVVEPLIGSPGSGGPAKSMAAKAARIMKGVGAVLPFVDIAMGIVALPVGIGMLIANAIRKKRPEPPAGPPRVRMRNGVRISNAGLELHT